MSPVLLLLVANLLVTAERYSDYAGANMPQYSMEEGIRFAAPPSEDYLERSPDAEAPIPFDYKYEEDFRDKENKLTMTYDEVKWHNQNKNLRESPNNSDDDDLQENEEGTSSKVKTSDVRRHRTRVIDKDDDEEQTNYKQKISSKDHRKINKDDIDIRKSYHLGSDEMREDNSIKSDDINLREKQKKVIRRKPRDKSLNFRRTHAEDEDVDEDLKSLDKDDLKYLDKNDFMRNHEGEYVPTRKKKFRRVMAEKPSRQFPGKAHRKSKKYPNYGDDYYDMKRVNDMKNRLPDLLRKTQTTSTETPIIRPVQEFPYRRANIPDRISTTISTMMSTQGSTTASSASSNTTSSLSQSNATELSLAEKSRLSILKKAQKKNEVKNVGLTTKPPVLMQVTKQLHTLVMVEPSVSFGVQEVFSDSPGRIAKAKQLMRHKLMANARNIHDLTDNWDEMVCDYIDVSLLNASSRVYPALRLLFIGSFISFNWLNGVLI